MLPVRFLVLTVCISSSLEASSGSSILAAISLGAMRSVPGIPGVVSRPGFMDFIVRAVGGHKQLADEVSRIQELLSLPAGPDSVKKNTTRLRHKRSHDDAEEKLAKDVKRWNPITGIPVLMAKLVTGRTPADDFWVKYQMEQFTPGEMFFIQEARQALKDGMQEMMEKMKSEIEVDIYSRVMYSLSQYMMPQPQPQYTPSMPQQQQTPSYNQYAQGVYRKKRMAARDSQSVRPDSGWPGPAVIDADVLEAAELYPTSVSSYIRDRMFVKLYFAGLRNILNELTLE